MTTTATHPTIDEFLAKCNEKARTRTFDDRDYGQFVRALEEAEEARNSVKWFFRENDAGCVANAYRYTTSTAYWGVWADRDGIYYRFGRRPISGRSVASSYYYGERAYRRHWDAADEKTMANAGRVQA